MREDGVQKTPSTSCSVGPHTFLGIVDPSICKSILPFSNPVRFINCSEVSWSVDNKMRSFRAELTDEPSGPKNKNRGAISTLRLSGL